MKELTTETLQGLISLMQPVVDIGRQFRGLAGGLYDLSMEANKMFPHLWLDHFYTTNKKLQNILKRIEKESINQKQNKNV